MVYFGEAGPRETVVVVVVMVMTKPSRPKTQSRLTPDWWLPDAQKKERGKKTPVGLVRMWVTRKGRWLA
jgi:hypothetical protein